MCAARRSTAPRDEPGATEEAGLARPSKSQRKREAHAQQELGVRLLALDDEALERMPLSEALVDAVRAARGIRSHEGRRRQLQLVGKLMRQADAEAIRAALAEETREHRLATAVMHAAERWRERILEDDAVLASWLAEFPETREQVTALARRARRERSAGNAATASRALSRPSRAGLAAQAAGRTAATAEQGREESDGRSQDRDGIGQ